MRKAVMLPVGIMLTLVAGGTGYAFADAYDLVPGILTLKPLHTYTEVEINTSSQIETPPVQFLLDSASAAPEVSAAAIEPIMKQLSKEVAGIKDQASAESDPGVANQGEEQAQPDQNSTPQPTPTTDRTVSAAVYDAVTGQQLGELNGDLTLSPASTTKLVAAATALQTLGADYRLATTVLQQADTIYLQGHGDQLLAAYYGDTGSANGYAGLANLADQVAAALGQQQITQVNLFLDDSRFGDQSQLPNWVQHYNTDYETTPVPLAINNGLASSELSYGYLPDPAWSAAEEFRNRLQERQIQVVDLQRGAASAEAKQIAQVEGAPLHQVIHETLKESNNMLAEVLCRASALSAGQAGTFEGEIAQAKTVLSTLGLDASQFNNQDCSGLSTENRLSANLLSKLLLAALSDQHPQIRPLISSLPVAALDGTLHNRYYQQVGQGVVRAKTGSLQNSNSLAGLVTTSQGRLLVFAVIINSQSGALGGATTMIDNFTNSLAAL